MPDRIAEDGAPINAKAGEAVVQAVGERLRADMRPEQSALPDRLKLLLDELRAQDGNTL